MRFRNLAYTSPKVYAATFGVNMSGLNCSAVTRPSVIISIRLQCFAGTTPVLRIFVTICGVTPSLLESSALEPTTWITLSSRSVFMSLLFTNSDLWSTPKGINNAAMISGMGRPRSRQPGPYADFGKRFVRACIEAGLPEPPKERCKVFGVNATTIGNWDHGDKLPSMDNAIQIATITGVSVDWLLTGRGEMKPRTAAAETLDISHLPSESKAATRALVHSFEHEGNGHTKAG